MVDIIYGRGITDILRELPYFISIFKKYSSIRLFKAKPVLYGSVDVNNVCNLHCSHCYWWLNRKNESDLSVKDWKEIIRNTFKKQKVFVVTLVCGWRANYEVVPTLSRFSVRKCQEEYVL